MLTLLLSWTLTSIVAGKLEVKCTTDLLQLVGEEVTECVARQQEIVREVEKVFSGEVYRQESVCVMISNILTKCGGMWSTCYTDMEVKELQTMQLNELKELYKEQLQSGNCQFVLEDMDKLEDMIIDSNDYSQEELEYLDGMDENNVITDNDEIMDYITEEYIGENFEEDNQGDVEFVEKPVKYESKPRRPDERPGFFGAVSKLFQPLFAIVP